jgi:hypothetical protein
MFEFTEKDGSMTRISHVSIMQVSTKHFTCLKHKKKTPEGGEEPEKKLPLDYEDTSGNKLPFEKR